MRNFRPSILKECTAILKKIRNQTECLLVGVHARRGDFAKESAIAKGYVAADANYINREHTTYLLQHQNDTWHA